MAFGNKSGTKGGHEWTPEQREDRLRCDWNRGRDDRCQLLGTVSDELYGEERKDGSIIPSLRTCAFHHDCRHNRAHNRWESFLEWQEQAREYSNQTEVRTIWVSYTATALWKALRGAQPLPPRQSDPAPSRQASPQYHKDAVRAALAVQRGELSAQEAIDALHAEHGCPKPCQDHPAGRPSFAERKEQEA